MKKIVIILICLFIAFYCFSNIFEVKLKNGEVLKVNAHHFTVEKRNTWKSLQYLYYVFWDGEYLTEMVFSIDVNDVLYIKKK